MENLTVESFFVSRTNLPYSSSLHGSTISVELLESDLANATPYRLLNTQHDLGWDVRKLNGCTAFPTTRNDREQQNVSELVKDKLKLQIVVHKRNFFMYYNAPCHRYT